MNDSLKKRIVIVEDQEELRNAFRIVINNTHHFKVESSYDNAEDCIRNLRKDRADIILMDINLPGLSGIDATIEIKESDRNAKVVILTILEDSEQVLSALKAGASGYITKNSTYLEIVAALEEILNGGAPLSSKVARMVVEHHHVNPNSPLTKRETEVLKALSVGKSFSEISHDLFIARETVKTHIHNIYVKLKVCRKSEALAMAFKHKWI